MVWQHNTGTVESARFLHIVGPAVKQTTGVTNFFKKSAKGALAT
jgi:hypothetical protein